MIGSETIAAMTSGRPVSGDGLHLLIMDLHKEINRLQSEISSEEVEGAKAYGITEADRSLFAAFMRGVKRTTSLKFDHPGLGTTAARSGGTLLMQNDLGTTEAHVLVVRVTETNAVVTHTDIHVQRLRFFQGLLAGTGIQWDELRSYQGSAITKGDLFYVARGQFDPRNCRRAEGKCGGMRFSERPSVFERQQDVVGRMQEWGTAVLTPSIMKLEHFLPLPDQDKEWLNSLVLRSGEFRAHSDVIREGEMPNGVFVVIAGHACRYKILPDGSRQILDFMPS